MASVYRAEDWEAEVLRRAFGPEVAEVVFYDADFPEETGSTFELAIAFGSDGREIGQLSPRDAAWRGGDDMGVGDLPGERGLSVKFWLTT